MANRASAASPSLQELWSNLPPSPTVGSLTSQPVGVSSGNRNKSGNDAVDRGAGACTDSDGELPSPPPAALRQFQNTSNRNTGAKCAAERMRKSMSAVEDIRRFKIDASLSKTKRLMRKGSDSTLLAAQDLILSAVSAKERNLRRVTLDLERVEGAILAFERKRSLENEERRKSSLGRRKSQSNPSFGGGDPGADDKSLFTKAVKVADRSQSGDSPVQLVDTDSAMDNLFKGESEPSQENFEPIDSDAETIFSCDEEDDETRDLLSRRHAKLQKEYAQLQSQVTEMKSKSKRIESALQASEGHAEILSKSTSDWAGMMKQTYQVTALQEQRRILKQGAMVQKHSTKKRGCGPRFLAYDSVNDALFWSKTLAGAVEICQVICDGESLKCRGPKTCSGGNSESSAGISKTMTVFPLSCISCVLWGDELTAKLRNGTLWDSKSKKAAVKHAAEQVCSTRPNHVLVLQSANQSGGNSPGSTVSATSSETVVFEFADADLAEAFAAGLKLVLEERAEYGGVSLDDAVAKAVTAAKGKLRKGKKGVGSFSNPDKRENDQGVANEASAGTPPTNTKYPAHGFSTPQQAVASRLLNKHASSGELNLVNSEHPSCGSTRSLVSTASVRSLNSSFEIKSLEPSKSSQSFRVSKLQRDLALTQSKDGYLDVLIGSSNQSSQLVLPLPSNEASRNKSAGHAQVLKDLQRESSVILNAKPFKLGNQDNTQRLIGKLSAMLRETLGTLSKESNGINESAISHWCKEILLAASRTVIEGDVYGVCHQLLLGPSDILLLPAMSGGLGIPMEIFVASTGVVSIESESRYRIVHMNNTEESWAVVHARCIEHLHFNSSQVAGVDERNIRSVKLEFFA